MVTTPTSTGRTSGPGRSAFVVAAMLLVPAFIVSFLLLSGLRWWTLRQLGATSLWLRAPEAPWVAALGPTVFLVVVVTAVLALAVKPHRLWRVAVVGVGICCLLAVALVMASGGAQQAVQCQRGRLSATIGLLTGLGLECMRLHYKQGIDTTDLPTGEVLWLADFDGTRWVRDSVSIRVYGVDHGFFTGWEVLNG